MKNNPPLLCLVLQAPGTHLIATAPRRMTRKSTLTMLEVPTDCARLESPFGGDTYLRCGKSNRTSVTRVLVLVHKSKVRFHVPPRVLDALKKRNAPGILLWLQRPYFSMKAYTHTYDVICASKTREGTSTAPCIYVDRKSSSCQSVHRVQFIRVRYEVRIESLVHHVFMFVDDLRTGEKKSVTQCWSPLMLTPIRWT